MIIFDILLSVAALVILLHVTLLLSQVILALLPGKPSLPSLSKRPAVAVLVPAHNEDLVLAKTLHLIFPQLAGGDRLLVVADNCSDDTAKIAEAAGAEVIERCDPERRGKGYALDFGVRHLGTNPPEVVIVIDADCEVGEGTIDRLAKVCAEVGRPVQALYLMFAPQGASLRVRVAEFAWLVKNQVRPLGYLRMGLPCELMGTGMAFPWDVISNASLASGHIVEDMKLGIDLTRAGKPPLFCPAALVTSVFPESTEGEQTQRTRWEHGHLGMIVREAPVLLAEAVFRGNLQLFASILDMSVPPLALLMLVVFVMLGLSAVSVTLGGSTLPLILTGAALLSMVGAVLLAWQRFGRQVLSLRDMTYAPVYVLRKIPLYLKFLVGKQVEWVRSKRDKD
jgi:cellulose synthase/poly-beta-1,6-N-acetylglucosamine synthase-like glycosyltransferase